MSIVFFCQSCGARFDVEPRLAGKKGRCKYCGHVTKVPMAEELSAVFTLRPLEPAAPGEAAIAPARTAAAVSSMPDWLQQSMSKLGLVPITEDRMPIARNKGHAPSPLDDAFDSKPYKLVKFSRKEARAARGGRPAGPLVRLWRGQLGTVQKVFRWLNESAYVVSIPFLIIFLFGTTIKDRNIALFGARFVVLLNVWALVAGIGNVAVVPLRDGLNPRKLKKPFRRIAEPIVTTAVVILAFSFVPWLAGSGARAGSVTERLRAGARDIKQEVQSELDSVVDRAEKLDPSKR
jgi:hypothetical protein